MLPPSRNEDFFFYRREPETVNFFSWWSTKRRALSSAAAHEVGPGSTFGQSRRTGQQGITGTAPYGVLAFFREEVGRMGPGSRERYSTSRFGIENPGLVWGVRRGRDWRQARLRTDVRGGGYRSE
jgi:hypothetical protein